MKKLKLILIALFLLMKMNTIVAQNNKGMCTVGTGLNPNVATFVDQNYINIAIDKALAAGYKHIKINKGLTLVDAPIILPGGVLLEGGGKGTIIQGNGTVLETLLRLNSANNIIQDLCFTTFGYNQGNEALSAISIENGANNNIIKNVTIGRIEGGTIHANNKIIVNLTSGTAINNSFENICFFKSESGIELNVTGSGVFSNNTFDNIILNEFINGIDFIGQGGEIDNNVFINIDAQARTSGTENLIRNVRGKNNTFKNINYADTPASGFIISITNMAFGTVLNNIESKTMIYAILKTIPQYEETNYNPPLANGKYINDLGINTQFINGANDESGAFRENSNVINASNITYKTNDLSESNFNIENFDRIKIKPKSNNPIVAGQVLTAIDTEGTVAWKAPTVESNSVSNQLNGSLLTTTVNGVASNPINLAELNPTLYTANGTLKTAGVTNNTRVVFMLDGNIGKGNFLKFTKDETNASNVMYLHTTAKNVGNNDQNCVVIGANGRALGEANNSASKRYHLIVNGSLKAKDEVLISNAGTWADYVFADDYSLKPLSEVESFINENGYLPNMPSASFIEKEGLSLGTIKIKQQEKIEELTLYAIQQEQKLELQEQQFEKISKQIEELKKITSELINKI